MTIPQSNGQTAASSRRLTSNYLNAAIAFLTTAGAAPSPENPDTLRRAWWALKSAAAAIQSTEDSWRVDADPVRAIDVALEAVTYAEREAGQDQIHAALVAAKRARKLYPGRSARIC